MSRSPSLCALCAFLTLCFLLTGCSQSNASPEEVVRAMCEAETSLPAGKLYVLSAPEDSEEYFPSALFAATFGNGSAPPELDLIDDAAIYFSYAASCELAAFLCKSADGTDAVAKMCLRRLDVLKNYRDSDRTSQIEATDLLENATVTVRGRWVILCVSSDPDAALRAFRRSL